MKNLFILFSFVSFALVVNAQICNPPCTPDPTCEDVLNPGEVCPEVLPVGSEGVYYDETVTVIPPSSYMGLPVIHSIKITNVSGLPEGMTWCKSQDVFLVTNPATRYCCQLYGTPAQAGEYPLTLTIVPYVNVFGQPVAQNPVTDDTSLVVIILPPPPVADFSAAATAIQINEPVQFQDLSSGNPTAWEWIFEGGTPETSLEQNPTVIYTAAGTYDVTLTVYNESGSSTLTKEDYIVVSDLSGINNTLPENVKIYPNPANSQIIVEATNIKEIKITDLLGKIIFSSKFDQDKQVVDVSNFNKGTYFITVITNSGEITKSITIK
ncbi:MAG: PKD domain-containing protein [Bacteroidales bacterium]|jgi:hypothetical protein